MKIHGEQNKQKINKIKFKKKPQKKIYKTKRNK